MYEKIFIAWFLVMALLAVVSATYDADDDYNES